jgi:hypothetical protein
MKLFTNYDLQEELLAVEEASTGLALLQYLRN